jgi:hypothetical protein
LGPVLGPVFGPRVRVPVLAARSKLLSPRAHGCIPVIVALRDSAPWFHAQPLSARPFNHRQSTILQVYREPQLLGQMAQFIHYSCRSRPLVRYSLRLWVLARKPSVSIVIVAESKVISAGNLDRPSSTNIARSVKAQSIKVMSADHLTAQYRAVVLYVH